MVKWFQSSSLKAFRASWCPSSGEEPEPPAFLVEAGRPGTRQGIDLALIAVDPAVAVGRGLLVAAELDARVGGHVELEVDLEDEVAVGLLGPQETVGSRADLADDRIPLDRVGRPSADLLPAGKRLAVEERDQGVVAGLSRGGNAAQTEQDEETAKQQSSHRSVPFTESRRSLPSRWGRSCRRP